MFGVREDINRINAIQCSKLWDTSAQRNEAEKKNIFELENNTRSSSDKAQNKWKNTQENRCYSVRPVLI